ncbi:MULTISPECIES: glycine zipper domain-containing protein [Cetobacterium]|uniref:YMGG-like glycine zipper-containing protein n=1 Tax=Candidatus Cetobacterium colombiensis TaxID=3073100 RepID=A0ABU4W9R4_9FUSO|nr:glycine zipper domain-containing protein [Candidatus Cetobacterium colombiensis]MDX8335155.1 YMGG-like glycine zipper-containing protein [Candidatus Cetobacterium colombiensis]
MKKYLLLSIVSLVLLSGCSNVGSNTIGSTTVGAGAGALLGQAIGGDSKATLLGAGIGALGGALVGSVQDQTQAIKDTNEQPYYGQPQYNQPQYNQPPQYNNQYNQQYDRPYYSQPYTSGY